MTCQCEEYSDEASYSIEGHVSMEIASSLRFSQ